MSALLLVFAVAGVGVILGLGLVCVALIGGRA